MADPSSIGDVIAGFVPEGPLRTLVIVTYGLCAAIAPFVYKYYLGVLAQGAKPEGSLERQDYDRLRASLKEGNLAERLYAKWLTAFLDWIEHFFGDAGMADRTLFPHAFGLKTPAPLWTAPAFDRCLLLALIYPIATIFLIWTISGHVGPAEAALHLDPLPGWGRGLIAVISFGYASFAIWRGLRAIGWKSRAVKSLESITVACVVSIIVILALRFASADPHAADTGRPGAVAFDFAVVFALAGIVASAVAFAVSVTGAGAVAVAVAIVFTFIGSGIFPRVLAGVLSFVRPDAIAANAIVILGLAFVGTVAMAGTVAVAIGVAVAVVNDIAVVHRRQGNFLVLYFGSTVPLSLAAAGLLAPSKSWIMVGPLLLFLGLLTLLNVPFDWASLGLTRALLRRGLELRGWWPYLLALVDACLAGVIIALLALTMVIGVQAFDELAVQGGGEEAAVLPLDQLFDGIAKNPAAPEYWWAYALLLSTMIPSLINLAIGGMALTRGVPGVSRLLLHSIPEGRDVPDYRRPLAALVLTGQMFAGAFLGIAAQAFLAWGLLYYLMPAVGLDLLWLCQQLAGWDLPGKFLQLTGIIR